MTGIWSDYYKEWGYDLWQAIFIVQIFNLDMQLVWQKNWTSISSIDCRSANHLLILQVNRVFFILSLLCATSPSANQ